MFTRKITSVAWMLAIGLVACVVIPVFADEPKFLRRADGKPIPNPNYTEPDRNTGGSGGGTTVVLPPYFPYGGVPTYGFHTPYRHHPYHCSYCGSPYCYDPYCDGPYYYPPRYVDASEYGFITPESARRDFLRGLQPSRAAMRTTPRVIGVAPNVNNRRAAPVAAETIAQRVAAIPQSNAAERARADRLLAQGDDLFERAAFLGARNKYESAVKIAGDYTAARYRLAHAMLAKGDYDSAVEQFLVALELADTIERPGFMLLDLYGGNRISADADLDGLSQAALTNPENGGLMMLVGLLLHYDQQPLRARPFFQRAAELAGPQARYAEWFLGNEK